MKKVLASIKQKKSEFAQLPLFEFMRDSSIDPRQRLAWAPCASSFAMNFRDFNRYILRDKTSRDKIQTIINQHSYEDERHWLWFLEDLAKLGFDLSMKFSDSLRFLWGEETKITRQICNKLALLYILQTNPIHKLVIIEAIEATGNVAFFETSQVAQEIQQITHQEYRYFGAYHFSSETGHAMGTEHIEQFIENIHLSEENRQQAIKLVEQVFELFAEFTNELLAYAKARQVEPMLQVI